MTKKFLSGALMVAATLASVVLVACGLLMLWAGGQALQGVASIVLGLVQMVTMVLSVRLERIYNRIDGVSQ